jgi:DNA-binding NarL/FixJ family response regulator
MTTILHVEDDEFFAAAVQSAFEIFGFPGRFVIASTLKEAEQLLGDPSQHLDLVISDMRLPDGTGHDVVRAVRSSRTHGHVPVLILSGGADVSTVSRAYALGASAYVTKTARGRTTAQIMRTIYEHWLQDVRLPAAGRAGHTHQAISIRSRIAQHYLAIAEQRGDEGADFWISVAQREANLANLMTFLLQRIGEPRLPDDALDELETNQKETLRVLDELEAQPPTTEDDALRYLLALCAPTDTPAFARCVALLFPVSPFAMAALLDAQATSFEVIAAHVEARTRDVELSRWASRLRGSAVSLRSQYPTT